MKLEPIIEIPCMTTGLWRRFAIHLFEGNGENIKITYPFELSFAESLLKG